MAAFEQSLTTLNNRLRQMTALNERKDREIDELRSQLDSSDRLTLEPPCATSEKSTSPICAQYNGHIQVVTERSAENPHHDDATHKPICYNEELIEQTASHDKQLDGKNLMKIIEDLKRQLIEKDRLLTDTRLEALSAAHQLEQLESRLNGEQSMLANEDDLDEGVMVVNHSPSDSDAITDSAHFGDQAKSNFFEHNKNRNGHQRNRYKQANNRTNNNLEDMILFTPQGHHTSSESHAGGLSSNSNHSNDDTNEIIQSHRQQQQQQDNQSDRSSSDYHDEDKSPGCDITSQQEFGTVNVTTEQTFESRDEEVMNKMLDKLLVSN
jgi:molybdopterin converting factor small subunit